MDRKEFLNLLGLSVGGMVVVSCLGSCADDSEDEPETVDFILNLTETANAALNSNGGFVVRNGIIVARTTAGVYIAVAAACTHQGTTVQYQSGNRRFFCPNHGSNFAEDGSVINGPATRPLREYQTQLTGTVLRVFS
jgi:cytochrome b6-f complex iron-sulfur subunit